MTEAPNLVPSGWEGVTWRGVAELFVNQRLWGSGGEKKRVKEEDGGNGGGVCRTGSAAVLEKHTVGACNEAGQRSGVEERGNGGEMTAVAADA